MVIGGTGMLRRASIAIAKSAQMFTAVAKRSESLNSLAQELGVPRNAASYYLALDWNQPTEFLAALSRHVEQVGPPSFVLAWLHDVNLGPHVAHAVTEKGSHCELFQVLGSDAVNPMSQTAAVRREIEQHDHLGYHQIILGCVRESGRTRWLNDEEISAGVLEAISLERPFHIVGTTEDWVGPS
jgi:hypothetical protein